jgi:predicted alpha/beta hydrolase
VASRVRFRAQDGYELAGFLHASGSDSAAANVAVVHCGAGIPASRYARFADFLAGRGIPTLTYDYRGIGLSRSASLRGFPATLEDWAQYDCAAAIGWLRSCFPKAEITGIAHSIGCLLLGAAENAGEQAKLVMIGGHTGYSGDYGRRYRLPMTLLWHGIMPAVTRLVGYFPGRRLGLGEDIPARIALQWAARRSPELRPTGTDPGDLRTQRLLDRCAALRRPVLLVSISDDAFATPSGIRRLMGYYPKLDPLTHLRFTPADAGVPRLGHFGLFARHAGAALWPRLLAQLQAAH